MLFGAVPALGESPWASHHVSRMMTINAHIWQIGQGDVMLFGDSNTEMFWWNYIGACEVINAGFGGATTAELARFAAPLAQAAMPSVVHIMTGTNDIGLDETSEAFADNLGQIVDAFTAVGARIVLWPIPPRTDKSGGYDLLSRDELQAAVGRVAEAKGVDFEEDWGRMLDAGSDGTNPFPPVIGDGVHLHPYAQQLRYQRIMEWLRVDGLACAGSEASS